MMNIQIMSNKHKKEVKVNLIKDKVGCLRKIKLREIHLKVNKEMFISKRNLI